MEWSWVAFGLGVLVGSGLAYVAGVVALAGRADRDEPEHFR